MKKKGAVVANINVGTVTWAKSFIKSAKENGIRVTDDPYENVHRIFIGDNIPISDILDNKRHLYFLAASSIPPSDSTDPETDEENESTNIHWADQTLVVSNSERMKLESTVPDLIGKVMVNGFPVSIKQIQDTSLGYEKLEKSVCFLGETRGIKNIDLEVELTQILRDIGYNAFHLSPGVVSRRKELELAGSKVVENVRGSEYWKLLSGFQYFVSTSFYESLGVSGIEATVAGCIPIVPDNSGFRDWCPPENRYTPDDEKHALELIRTQNNWVECMDRVGWYDSREFFSRINLI